MSNLTMKVVYLHKDLQGNVFYVGCGNEKRPYNKEGRSDEWKAKILNGYTVEIVDELPYILAFRLEGELISEYGLDNLVNKRNTKDPFKQQPLSTLKKNQYKQQMIISNTKRINVSITDENLKKAQEVSLKVLGSTNVSALIGYLINKEHKTL